MRWVCVLALIAMACGGSDQRTEVLVSAASSLTGAFTDIERAFEEANPSYDAVLNLAGSSALREQVIGGAPADVFAPADLRNMEMVEMADEVWGEARVFARNSVLIATPGDNPGGVTGLADFARSDLLIGLCAEEVPCGELARRALDDAGVTPSVDTREPNVRSLLTKIEAGELDAGIVYGTDVLSTAGRTTGINLPHEVLADYPVAVLTGGRNREGASAFVAFLLSEQGQSILGSYGFLPP